MSRPLDTEYGSFYKGYADAATGETLASVLQIHSPFIREQILSIPASICDFRYAPDKWSIKELLQHMIDTERVFGYRALRIARNDQTPLPGFDENHFAANAPVAHRNWNDLVKEFLLVREATDMMVQSFQEEQLNNWGTASNSKITLRAICFILYGHNLHHLKIMKERYF